MQQALIIPIPKNFNIIMDMANNNITRVMLWSPPRSGSTALLKCLTYVPNSQMWCEPYLFVNFCGQDGTYRDVWLKWLKEYRGVQDLQGELSRIKGGFRAQDVTLSWVKNQLESNPPNGINVIVCKELVWSMVDHYEHIPRGFKHTFLIRHPYKVFTSWKKMINQGFDDPTKQMTLTDQPEFLLPKGYHFKELYDMWQHVMKTEDSNPVIIDADDLMNDPGTVLKAYCNAVGVPYSDDLLSWERGRHCMDEMWMVSKEGISRHDGGGHALAVFESTGFIKPNPCPRRETLDTDVLLCSDASMKYYEAMYANRLTF